MKKILLLLTLCLVGCDGRVSSTVGTSPSGHVNINGKNCSVHLVNIGDNSPRLYFIDCGPGSSSVTFQSGKNQHTTVGQYVSPEPANIDDGGVTCSCPQKNK